MDYIIRYGLEFNPFLKDSKEILIPTRESKEVQFRLDYLANVRGFGLLTGGSGRGKTTAVRTWAKGLNPSLYKVFYTCFSTLTATEFFYNLAMEVGVQPSFRKSINFRLIQGELTKLSLDKRRTPVLIIDEANYINNAILNDFKLLFNFEMDSRNRAVVLLCGLPVLSSTLRLNIHEPFRQRIIMSYEMSGLSKEEGRSYIQGKLSGAGATRPIFEEAALEAILNSADGTPRVISNLCNSCLLIGDARKCDIITPEIVMQAVNNSEL